LNFTVDGKNAMSEEKKDKIMQDGVSRRSVLGMGSAALAAAAFGGLWRHAQTREDTHQAEDDHSSSTRGQENKPLLSENPHSNAPPPTDQEDQFAGLASAC
jgi:oxalate decarboxylase